MSDLLQTPTLKQVAIWLQESAGIQVNGDKDSITLKNASGDEALTLRSAMNGHAVSLMASVASLPLDTSLAAVIQVHLLRLCADPHALHGMRVALTADERGVVLLDPTLQVQDAQAMLERFALALEMSEALGAEIKLLVAEPSMSAGQMREATHALWP